MTNLASGLAGALLGQGRVDDAAEFADLARDTAPPEDASGQAWWRMVTAEVLARRGDVDEAVQLAEESTAILEGTDELLTLPDLVLRQGEVLRLAGRTDEANAALKRAVEVSERKGAVVEARRARELLASISPDS